MPETIHVNGDWVTVDFNVSVHWPGAGTFTVRICEEEMLVNIADGALLSNFDPSGCVRI